MIMLFAIREIKRNFHSTNEGRADQRKRAPHTFKKINPSVKMEEIHFLDEQMEHLEKAFKDADVTLDSFRLVL